MTCQTLMIERKSGETHPLPRGGTDFIQRGLNKCQRGPTRYRVVVLTSYMITIAVKLAAVP